MKPDVKWLRDNYKLYNEKYFGGKLPEIDIKPSTRMKTSWGYASYVARYDSYLKKVVASNLSITVNTKFDIEEKWCRNTLLHEMIHIFEYVTHFNNVFYKYDEKSRKIVTLRYNAHGEFFLKKAAELNRDGWNIQQYLTEEEEKIADAQFAGQKAIILVYKLNYHFNKRTSKFTDSRTETSFCIIKTDEDHMNKTADNIRKRSDEYKKEYKLKKDLIDFDTKVEIYETTNPEIVRLRNTLTTLRGFYEDEAGTVQFLERYNCKKKL